MTQHTCRDILPLIPRLHRRARRLVSDRATADDLLQETLLRLCQQIKREAQIDDLNAYAMRIMRNEAQRKWAAPDQVELEDDMITALPEALTRLECSETLAAIARLPEAHQTLFAHVIAGDTSPASISKSTGLPLGTVMSRLARARAKLREDLNR